MNSDKQHAQQLLNCLGPEQVAAVVHLMEVMLDPRSQNLVEDEEISEEEEQAVIRSKEWFQEHDGIPFEEVAADIGLTMAQIRNHRHKEDAAA